MIYFLYRKIFLGKMRKNRKMFLSKVCKDRKIITDFVYQIV